MDNVEEIRERIKRKRYDNKMDVKKKSASIFKNKTSYKIITKILLTTILLLTSLILIKSNKDFKKLFYKEVYEKNFSFAEMNNLYQKYLGDIIPFQNIFKEETKPVFNETLKYKEATQYNNGVKLTVDNNYLIPINESGMVVYIGEKEGLGNTVIIQQMNGIDLWYGNVTNLNIKLYDYVEKGSLLGEADGDFIYLVYKKEGNDLDYQEYLPQN